MKKSINLYKQNNGDEKKKTIVKSKIAWDLVFVIVKD